ncbi:MAG: phage major tail tube protein [Citromicrobium sp.]|nr:phage major tail tube protein [Citromicrobium sp.]
MLPSKLKNFNVFSEAVPYLGIAKEIELPKITMAGEEYRGAGMLAPVDMDLGLEKLEHTVTYGGIIPAIMRQLGEPRFDGLQLRYVGAYQADDTGLPAIAELVTRGRISEMDPGNAQAGEDTEWKVQSTLSYLKWSVNGTEVIAIDVLNGMYRVSGVDRMLGIRAALGV